MTGHLGRIRFSETGFRLKKSETGFGFGVMIECTFLLSGQQDIMHIMYEGASRPTAGRLGDLLSDRQE